MSYWVTAYLGLGSNLGGEYCPRTNLCRACWALSDCEGLRIEKVSSVYKSAPWGELDQPDFYNLVIQIETLLSPPQLLAAVKHVEVQLGRQPTYRWGPRTIDIDILLYAQLEVQEPDLEIPHRYLLERPFAYVPLLEIAPEARLPDGRELRALVGGRINGAELECVGPLGR